MRNRLKRLSWHTFAPLFYWGCTYLLRFLLRILTNWKVTGRENVPRTGALIVISNHLHNSDPPMIGAGIARRRIRWMAKIELFKMPFGIVPRLWDAFPVRRFESDLAAMLNAERILKRGGVLGMFPEGHRSLTGYMGLAHPGTAMIALRSGATVLPCAITGTEQFRKPLVVFRRPTFTLTIGEPIHLEAVRRPTEAQISELTGRMVAAIQAQLPATYLPPPYTESGEVAATAHGTDHPRE
jgi:1-acyl-sn-glycerol-3-phosphate acyltransferase